MRPHELPEYDWEFVERQIRDSERIARGEEPLDSWAVDDDATFGGLCQRLLARLFPPTFRTDFTVRADAISLESRHVGSLLHMLREGLALGATQLLVLALVVGMPATARSSVFWLVTVVLCGALSELLIPTQYRVLFLLAFPSVMAWSVLTAGPEHDVAIYRALLPVAAFWYVLCLMIRAPASTWLRRAFVLCGALGLAEHLENPSSATHWLETGVMFFVANALGTGVIAVGFQRWMLAGRRIDLATLRTYLGRRRLNSSARSLRMTTRWLNYASGLTALAWSASMALFIEKFSGAVGEPVREWSAIVFLSLCWLACHTGNWLLAELGYHRRLPRPGAWLRSWYVTWRGLTAWLAYVPTIQAPAVFQFPRPWSNIGLRLLIVSGCLLINSAFSQSIAWRWLSVPAQVQSMAELRTWPPTQGDETPRFRIELWSYQTLLLGAVYLSVLPFLLFWLSLTAIWGPRLTAAHDAHETFNRSARAPALGWFRP